MSSGSIIWVSLKNKTFLFIVCLLFFVLEQAFFKYKWWAEQLKNVTHFFVQDKNSAELLKSVGFKNTTISGDSRFDSVLATTQNPVRSFPLIEQFSKTKAYYYLRGSTWPKG